MKAMRIALGSFLLVTLFVSVSQAQVDTGKTDNLDALPITACATGGRVRFTAPGTVVQMRLEIYRENGEKMFDNEIRGGNVVDWLLQDGQAERLSDGFYLGVVTVKTLSGRMSQKLGKVTIQNAEAVV